MKIFYFSDIISNLSLEQYDEIRDETIKQISRGNYSITDNTVEIVILYNDEQIKTIISNSIERYDFCQQIFSYCEEPSVKYFRDKVNSYEERKIVDILKKYKDENKVMGYALKDKIWLKLYNKTEPRDEKRNKYHAKWIDYEKELKNGKIIFDLYKTNGLWAFPVKMLPKCLNAETIQRYGDGILVLKPVEDCEYLLDGPEIIGNKYEVIDKFTLTDTEDFKKLLQILFDMSDSEINRLEWNCQNEKNESHRIINELNQKIHRINNGRLMIFILGIILGIIVSCSINFNL